MSQQEQYYIALCKKLIEEKFSFGNGQGYSQRDLEILSHRIEESTGVYISLSTLKRLWKNNFKQSPQLATLNALVSVLDYKDWQEFKSSNQKNVNKVFYRSPWFIGGVISVVLLTALTFLTGKNGVMKMKQPEITGPVYFSAEKTVTSGIPNTVIFNYDVSNVKADSFYIQQSWNKFHRVPIDPKSKVFTSIYYESGFHRARLIANDSVIAMQPVHIISNGWEPHIYYGDEDLIPVDFKNEEFIKEGQLHLSKTLLEKQSVDLLKSFYSRISNSKEFNISSDNFSLISRLKSDNVLNSLCPWINQIIVTENHIFRVSLEKKGCENQASYKLGEIVRSGRDTDLSALGCDVSDWQEVEIRVRNKKAEILINGKTAFTEVYKEDFGKIVGLIYMFDGTGSLDYVRLEDAEGLPVFEDNF